MVVGSAPAGDGENVYCHPSTRVEVERCFFVFSCALIVAPAECIQAFPSVWSTCQWVLISCVIGRTQVVESLHNSCFRYRKPWIDKKLAVLAVENRDIASRTLMPRRRGYVLIFAWAASSIIVGTMPLLRIFHIDNIDITFLSPVLIVDAYLFCIRVFPSTVAILIMWSFQLEQLRLSLMSCQLQKLHEAIKYKHTMRRIFRSVCIYTIW